MLIKITEYNISMNMVPISDFSNYRNNIAMTEFATIQNIQNHF